MGRRVLNRRELRENFDAAERQKPDEEELDEEEGAEEDEEEEEAEPSDDLEEEDEGEGDEDDEEEVKPKKKKKAPVKEKAKPKPRSRASKVVRMKVVWKVFNNSNQPIATYDYPKRKDAEDHAAKLTADKKSTHFVQPVKEPIEEKKEK